MTIADFVYNKGVCKETEWNNIPLVKVPENLSNKIDNVTFITIHPCCKNPLLVNLGTGETVFVFRHKDRHYLVNTEGYTYARYIVRIK